MNPSRITLLIVSVILFGLFWVTGGDEITDYTPYYWQRLIGSSVTVSIMGQDMHVEVARSNHAKARGLSGRRNLPTGQGMLFVFSEAGSYEFWMKDMRLSLDIVWIHDGKIIDISRNIPPPAKGAEPARVRPAYPASQVLEVSSGVAASWQPGDMVTIKNNRPLFLL
ncbi:MAG: DUF192 domain-containing protein [Patescibacteria group bacterium]